MTPTCLAGHNATAELSEADTAQPLFSASKLLADTDSASQRVCILKEGLERN